MRFLRVACLVVGVALVVIGVAGIFGRRQELGDERDRRLETTAELAATQLDAAVARVGAALTVASPDLGVQELADVVGHPVCAVGDGAPACSSDDGSAIATPATVAAALDASVRRGSPVVVADTAGPAPSILVAVDQGTRQLFVPLALDATVHAATAGSVQLIPLGQEPLFRPRTVDGQRLLVAPSMVEFEDGPWALRVGAPAAVHLSTDERWLLGGQLLLGGVLALLALGGMLAEQRTLHHKATTDALTKLPNREEFTRRARDVLTRLDRDGRTACLFLIDLDHFKVVNDTVGHDAGDRVLVDAAERLRTTVRASDLVGRWGGDEFVVLMPGIGDARAVPTRAATIANALAGAPTIGTFALEASVGAALFPVHGRALEDLLRKADRAMYAAKDRSVRRREPDPARIDGQDGGDVALYDASTWPTPP